MMYEIVNIYISVTIFVFCSTIINYILQIYGVQDEYTNRHRAAKLVILSPLWFIWAVVLIVNFCKNIFYDLRNG